MKGRRARPRGPCRDHGVVTVEPLPARYLARDLLSAGLTRRAPLVVVLAADGLGLAWEGGSRALVGGRDQLVEALVEVERHGELAPRWTWWSARTTATPLVQSGFRPRATWDLAASGRLACGSRRVDPGAVWAAAHDLPEPDELGRGDGDLFDLDASDGRPVLDDGQLSRGIDDRRVNQKESIRAAFEAGGSRVVFRDAEDAGTVPHAACAAWRRRQRIW